MEGNYYRHKVKWCPICSQGWVEIVKDMETGTLFCCCTECESEWDDTYSIERTSCNPQDKYGRVCEATEEEIEEKGYGQLIIKQH